MCMVVSEYHYLSVTLSRCKKCTTNINDRIHLLHAASMIGVMNPLDASMGKTPAYGGLPLLLTDESCFPSAHFKAPSAGVNVCKVITVPKEQMISSSQDTRARKNSTEGWSCGETQVAMDNCQWVSMIASGCESGSAMLTFPQQHGVANVPGACVDSIWVLMHGSPVFAITSYHTYDSKGSPCTRIVLGGRYAHITIWTVKVNQQNVLLYQKEKSIFANSMHMAIYCLSTIHHSTLGWILLCGGMEYNDQCTGVSLWELSSFTNIANIYSGKRRIMAISYHSIVCTPIRTVPLTFTSFVDVNSLEHLSHYTTPSLLLAAGSDDNNIYIWKLTTASELLSTYNVDDKQDCTSMCVELFLKLSLHEDTISSLCFWMPNSNQIQNASTTGSESKSITALVCGSRDGSVSFWDIFDTSGPISRHLTMTCKIKSTNETSGRKNELIVTLLPKPIDWDFVPTARLMLHEYCTDRKSIKSCELIELCPGLFNGRHKDDRKSLPLKPHEKKYWVFSPTTGASIAVELSAPYVYMPPLSLLGVGDIGGKVTIYNVCVIWRKYRRGRCSSFYHVYSHLVWRANHPLGESSLAMSPPIGDGSKDGSSVFVLLTQDLFDHICSYL